LLAALHASVATRRLFAMDGLKAQRSSTGQAFAKPDNARKRINNTEATPLRARDQQATIVRSKVKRCKKALRTALARDCGLRRSP
jgi:hypothetical protein